MKVLLLCGNAPNHLALAHKFRQRHDLVGLIIERRNHPMWFWPISSLFAKVLDVLLFRKIGNTWSQLMTKYQSSFPELPVVPTINVENINSPEVIAFVEKTDADLIAVSGTSIIAKSFFAVKPNRGIINLHTGLSPYVRGGPNSSNWCIANDEIHLIGTTIMWLDKGIDSGNIIASAPVHFSGDETYLEMHEKIMEHAHELYLDTVDALDQNYDQCQSVKQKDIAVGNLYLSKMWNSVMKSRLIKNLNRGSFKTAIQSEDHAKKQSALTYVNLPNKVHTA